MTAVLDNTVTANELSYAHIVTTVARHQVQTPSVASLHQKLDKVSQIRGDLSKMPNNWHQVSITEFGRRFFRETPIGFVFEVMMGDSGESGQYVLFYYRDGIGLALGLINKKVPTMLKNPKKIQVENKPVIRLFKFGCNHKFVVTKPREPGNIRDTEVQRCILCGFTTEIDSTD